MRFSPTGSTGISREIVTADGLPNVIPTLLDRTRAKIRKRHYSRRTEEACLSWIARYLRFHKIVDPLEAGEAEVERFLSYLADSREVAAATQNQALSAILFLYTEPAHPPGRNPATIRTRFEMRRRLR